MNNRACLRKEEWITTEPGRRVLEKPLNTKTKIRLRFRPRSFWPFLTWGLALFLGFKILFIPLIEGVYHLAVKSQEVNALKKEHQRMAQQLEELKKSRDYMKTIAYVEEQSHKAGFIKINELPMLVIDTSGGILQETKQPSNNRIED
ncbi:MAG: hypothetical protein GX075_09840 [Firmicutes bacterium]|nr:hypothetical protein [Bacillota bacterium]